MEFFSGGQDRIRTYEGARPADLQSAAFDHFATCPWSRLSDSNRPPTVYKTVALPDELSRHDTKQFYQKII